MTATATAAPARRAAASSACAGDRCTVIIRPGDLIQRLPGKGWAHRECARQAATTKEDPCD